MKDVSLECGGKRGQSVVIMGTIMMIRVVLLSCVMSSLLR